MTIKKALIGSGLVFLLMFIIGIRYAAAGTLFPTRAGVGVQQQAGDGQSDVDQAVQTAFQAAADQNRSLILGFQVYEVVVDHIQYAQDGNTALLWLALRDRQTGEVVESEPGLSIASNPNSLPGNDAASWNILLPGEPTFDQQLRALPPELLSDDIRARFLAAAPPESQLLAGQVFSGYKLPWTAGASKRMTNSIGHVYSVSGGLTSCPTTCRYAFDFADGTMFPMLAAKGGMVKAFKWTCPNFGTDCTNYLVLEDQSTVPTSYQLYYHLAYNSIPLNLRAVGAIVQQGEYIGDADDTGFSTGHHLHFHVYTTPTGTNWSWGPSVDITFDDVPVNGGRPRTCAEASEYPDLGSECLPNDRYTSGNTPAHPPLGSLDLPGDRLFITSPTVRLQGWASDDIQITRIQVVANYDGAWKTVDDIAPTPEGPYAKDVDLCAANVPDGPFALTVRIYDREGSQAPGIPVRQLIKNYACSGQNLPPSPPACIPAANQAALYAETDFRGACQLFNLNNGQGYTADTFGALGSDNAASVMVGSDVRAVLFDRSSDVPLTRPLGRVETFAASDAGLSDNLIGSNRVSGLWVVGRDQPPDEPFINPIGNRLTGNNPSATDSLVLSWEGGGGAAAFDTTLTGPGTNLARTVTGNSLPVGNLAAGNYTFVVTARNESGANSSQVNFTVAAGSLPVATARAVPYQDSMEAGTSGWTATGLWRLASVDAGGRGASMAWIFNNGTSYADSTYRAGDLTSPPIALPAGTTYYLRFLYFMDTEDAFLNWDQRRVQISQNGGPFQDLVQLSDDKAAADQVWLKSSVINLQKYAGSTVRLRFHFDTVDEDRNSGLGWMIDDVSITSTAPNATCGDNNNSPETAQAVSSNQVISALICPEGDLDYYRISASAGQPVMVNINARTLSPASKLDSVVQFLDADGRSIIAENDDEVYGKLQDSLLTYTVWRSGNYLIKVKAWNHPGVGGTDFPYQMDLRPVVPVPPKAIDYIFPNTRYVPSIPFTIAVTARDFDDSAVAKVDFYWHGPDWNSAWVKLGSDANASDGWSFQVDPALYGGVSGAAVYVQAVSKTGGVLGKVIWDLDRDVSVPVSQMNALASQTFSTAIRLSWSASDEQNDIDRFEVQYQVSTGGSFSAWQAWNRALPGELRQAWFVGAAGSSYRFRMRAIDRLGNTEAYPDAAEAATVIASACIPDKNEIGQTADHAVPVNRGSASPVFNLCKSTTDGYGDVDWVTFDAQAGEQLLLILMPRGGGAKLQASLYSAQSQLLGTWQSPDFQNSIAVRFKAPVTGTYYLEIKPSQSDLFGTDMTYQAWFGPGYWYYLPKAGR